LLSSVSYQQALVLIVSEALFDLCTMTTQIYLVFTDDWELRGDGSGDPTEIQFRPLRELTRRFAERSIRGSFNAEVLQQLTFRRFQDRYPHLKAWADEWEQIVTDAFREGHDFQLHLHPQWKGASYNGKRWTLPAPWSILEHPREDVARMIAKGVELLQSLLKPIHPQYRCVSFRAGAWCIAPSGFMLDLLAAQDIRFDMSIVRGISYKSPVQFDYRHVEEGFFPFYPDMRDARCVATAKQPIVCIPTTCFPESSLVLVRRDSRKLLNKFFTAKGNPTPTNLAAGVSSSAVYDQWQVSLLTRILRRLRNYFTGRWLISDIAQLDYAQLADMLRYIRGMAQRSGTSGVPVILANHTKDIVDFSHIERFLDDIATAPDISCITLTELSRMLESGRFSIRIKK
jgi:hypothetical protein